VKGLEFAILLELLADGDPLQERGIRQIGYHTTPIFHGNTQRVMAIIFCLPTMYTRNSQRVYSDIMRCLICGINADLRT
jgi:hypothetical protein